MRVSDRYIRRNSSKALYSEALEHHSFEFWYFCDDGKTFLRLCFWIILARCCHTLNLTFYCSDVHSYEQHDLYENGIRLDMKTAIVFSNKGNGKYMLNTARHEEQSMHDAHVLLQKNHSDVVNDIVEIVLGGWSNTRSVMRNQIFGQALSTYYSGLRARNAAI
ncbi:uncharacterized protein LOC128558715 [Mercenaria mercenaria]|uniref:uncharacterized protein LOC128558715 n=1 Tax=Mercenaria mercenaria TaxID=6596 RepID=UPI00234EA0C8|nr:uncharacterized protein LOC128558715 [Mercenaria mercenaria]